MPNGATISPTMRYSSGEVGCCVILDVGFWILSLAIQNPKSKTVLLDIDVNALVLARRRHAHQVADGFGDPPVAPDHLAGLIGGDGQLIRDRVAPGALLDLHSLGI